MMRSILLILCCCSLSFAQSRDFKELVMRGIESLENKNYASALDAYTKAYQLEKKADVIRLEGTFTAPYLPCYSIALAHEGLGDLIAADEWVQRSKDALESEAISRKRKELAAYNQDIERIQNSAKAKRQEMEAEFMLALNKANDLLDQNRFDQARTAFEQLYKDYPGRNEPSLGLERIKTRRAGFLRELSLKIQQATLDQDFNKADALLAQYRQMDPSSSDLPSLVARVNSAKERANTVTQPEPEPQPVQTVAKNEPDKPTGPSPEELERRRQAQAARERERRFEQNKSSLRSALLATLAPYRRGDVGVALQQIRAINVEGAEKYGSYHWLKGVYLLSFHKQSVDPESGLLMEAREAIANTKRLQPNFQPDPKLYPSHIIAFFDETQTAGAGEAP